MKEKTKEFFKKYLIGFILGVVSACTISVIAATYFPSNQTTYDNTNTELQSTNVQDAIDELYGVCFPPKTGGDSILDNTDIVTSGDGLYEDETETDRYFYRGKDPQNYLLFNNELWRILSIQSDGTIKIIRNEIDDLGNRKDWEENGDNDWTNASLKTYLNGTYYNGLNATARSQIASHSWSIGKIQEGGSSKGTDVNNENSKKWTGNVGLVSITEYIRSNSNQVNCSSVGSVNSQYNKSLCGRTTWLNSTTSAYWTITAIKNNNDAYAYGIADSSYALGILTAKSIHNLGAVRPTLYLSSDIKITGGTGTKSDPYTIE